MVYRPLEQLRVKDSQLGYTLKWMELSLDSLLSAHKDFLDMTAKPNVEATLKKAEESYPKVKGQLDYNELNDAIKARWGEIRRNHIRERVKDNLSVYLDRRRQIEIEYRTYEENKYEILVKDPSKKTRKLLTQIEIEYQKLRMSENGIFHENPTFYELVRDLLFEHSTE